MTTTAKFEAGKTYFRVWTEDNGRPHTSKYTVEKRTAKMVIINGSRSKIKVDESDGSEYIRYSYGTYIYAKDIYGEATIKAQADADNWWNEQDKIANQRTIEINREYAMLEAVVSTDAQDAAVEAENELANNNVANIANANDEVKAIEARMSQIVAERTEWFDALDEAEANDEISQDWIDHIHKELETLLDEYHELLIKREELIDASKNKLPRVEDYIVSPEAQEIAIETEINAAGTVVIEENPITDRERAELKIDGFKFILTIFLPCLHPIFKNYISPCHRTYKSFNALERFGGNFIHEDAWSLETIDGSVIAKGENDTDFFKFIVADTDGSEEDSDEDLNLQFFSIQEDDSDDELLDEPVETVIEKISNDTADNFNNKLAELKAQINLAENQYSSAMDDVSKAYEAWQAAKQKANMTFDKLSEAVQAMKQLGREKARSLRDTLLTKDIILAEGLTILNQQGEPSKERLNQIWISFQDEGTFLISAGADDYAIYDTPEQVKSAVCLLKEAINNNQSAFTFPSVDELENQTFIAQDGTKYIVDGEPQITSDNCYLKINDLTVAQYQSPEAAKAATDYLIDFRENYGGECCLPHKTFNPDDYETIFDDNSIETNDGKIILVKAKRNSVSDSLARAMKINLENIQKHCKAKNLTAANYEMSLYNICSKALQGEEKNKLIN